MDFDFDTSPQNDTQNNNSLTNIDDISFSVSLTLDENMNSKNDLTLVN